MQNKDKQIEEMAEIILDVDRSYYGMECDEIQAKAEATAIYDKGYRLIYDDHQRQCTCYALGCQMAEELKKEVARETFEEIDECYVQMLEEVDNTIEEAILDANHSLARTARYGKDVMLLTLDTLRKRLKKKYTEGGE